MEGTASVVNHEGNKMKTTLEQYKRAVEKILSHYTTPTGKSSSYIIIYAVFLTLVNHNIFFFNPKVKIEINSILLENIVKASLRLSSGIYKSSCAILCYCYLFILTLKVSPGDTRL